MNMWTPPSPRSHVLAMGHRRLQDQTVPHSDLLTYFRPLRAHKAAESSSGKQPPENVHMGSGTLICICRRFQDPSCH